MAYLAEESVIDLLTKIEANTRGIANWLQIAYGAELRRRLQAILSDKRRRLVYESSVDENSSRTVSQLAGVSDRTVREWWREWSDMELVEPASVPGRFRKKFSLAELGVEAAAGREAATREDTA